ncbi:MAG: mandelate racemase/muconate lactonizing enzyme family protein [Ferrovibrio sp.]|uniref:mandelate racemase/muconate lactonizing enzyme family protein n=1 Tax=Ferrovibrio sp. TaxID=1917215 RepID=UPI00391C7D3C
MRIKSIDTVTLKIPFGDLYDGPRAKRRGWTEFDTLLLRVETEDGLVGWGEAFAYSCASAVRAAVHDMVAPLAIGRDTADIPALSRDLQKELHIWGRYGITIFALSGLDIALWDIAGKRAGKSLSALLGRRRDQVQAYASLVRYGGAEPITRMTQKAVAEGYGDIKLHEIAYEAIAAARAAAGPHIRITTDVNCGWSLAEAEALLPKMKDLDLFWVEEPIFPPEDYETLASLRHRFGVPLSAGENACTAMEFRRLIAALDYPQPSVTKVGGVSEFQAVARLAAVAGKTLMPHSPYFGPGYWATLQLAAHLEHVGLFEFLYVKPDAFCGRDIPLPQQGHITIPDTPGIGFVPDEDVLARYRIA